MEKRWGEKSGVELIWGTCSMEEIEHFGNLNGDSDTKSCIFLS